MTTAFRVGPVLRAAVVLGATAATVVLSQPPASAAPNADLSPLDVSPTTIEVGQPVTVSGSGCLLSGEPRPFLVQYTGGPPEGAASGWADEAGSWSATFPLADAGPGTYTIEARCDMIEGYESYAPVSVTVVAPSAATEPPAAPAPAASATGPTDDEGSGPAVPVTLAAAAAVLLLGASGYLVHRRRASRAPTADAPPPPGAPDPADDPAASPRS
jgi:hypothetical protein